jgi:Rrf2 family nitric oxide-sensitive transcriptional repressor
MAVMLDNGIRLLLLAAGRHPFRVTIAETAEAFGASHPHLAKAANLLVRRGFLASRRGKRGGLFLARSPETICLAEVAAALVSCEARSDALDTLQGWRTIEQGAALAYKGYLARHTLADLLEPANSR